MDYTVTLGWQPGTQEGVADTDGKPEVAVSAPAELGGNGGCWSPEHLLVSSLQSCLMLTALYFVKQKGIQLTAYHSTATGTMSKSPEGLRFTTIRVSVDATVATGEDEPKLQDAMKLAKQYCPVSAALATPVDVALSVQVG